jgi:integrase
MVDSGAVFVRRSLEEINGRVRLKDVKTAKARRRIDLAPDTVAALNEHRRRMLAEGHDVRTGPVFVDAKGEFLRKSNVARRSFRPIFERANEKVEKESRERGTAPALLPVIRFHDLRHTCASLLLLADVNVKVVSERLGHASIEITLNTYSHVLPTMQKKAAEKMAGIFGIARASTAIS